MGFGKRMLKETHLVTSASSFRNRTWLENQKKRRRFRTLLCYRRLSLKRTLIVHAVDEKARAYYNFEGLWATNASNIEQTQDLEKAFVKVRRKNNSKKPSQARS